MNVCSKFRLFLYYFVVVVALSTALIAQSQITDQALAQHAQLYSSNHSTVNILSRVSKGENVKIKYVETFQEPAVSDYEMGLPAYPDLELRRLACDADTVIVGTATASRSAITPAGDFAFTGVSFHVSSVIKGSAGTNIVVTRPGGETVLAGRSVQVDVVGFPSFEIGTEYVLFLRSLPQSNSYRAYKNGSFRLAPTASRLNGQQLAMKSATSRTSFLAEVRDAVNSPVSCSMLAKVLEQGGNQ